MRIAIGIVLYNPDEILFNNINRYRDYDADVYVYDNSDKENKNREYLCDRFKLIYSCGYNSGICYAINVIAKKAKDNGNDWILFMDQDSYIDKKNFCKMKKNITLVLQENENVAVISGTDSKQEEKEGYTEVTQTITSGSCYNLKNWLKYDEDFFIYVADYEYCWHARRENLKVIKSNGFVFEHQIIDDKNKKSSKYAYYYAARNNVLLIKKYKRIFPQLCKQRKHGFLKVWLCQVIHEERRILKILWFLKGLMDGRNNITGKYMDEKKHT